ncbi:hypothetical protein FRC03_007074 [Tulasnella sp. 419]|nr:hypothetical protein FRC03_007074 [Tulasnella sp. 419]
MDIEGDARSHAFLGNYTKIREVLKKYPFGENEDGVLEAIGVARDARSGLVNGFDWKPIRPKDFSLGLEGSRCDIQVN